MVEENVLERIIFWRTKRPVGGNTREWDTVKQVKSMIEEKYEKQTRVVNHIDRIEKHISNEMM